MTFISLIDFWRLERKNMGLSCEVMPHHHIIADKLTDLVLGRLSKPNLMILMPPRCGKTDLGIKGFVPWSHSYFPDSEYINTSYSKDLALDNTSSCRDVMASDWYRSMCGSDWGAKVPLIGEKAGGRQDHFYTLQGGSVKGVGRGGGITGFGAGKLREEWGGCIIIDDLLKANEKDSAAARKDAVNYINGTLKSRRNRQDKPSTPMVLIMQRLHPEDPAGWLLREEKDEWDVLQIPAHDGDNVIWPGRLNMETLMTMAETDPETYYAQYMQNPSQSSNIIFNPTWWRYWKDRMAVERRITFKIITGDTAYEEKTSADWSVFQCWGFENTSGMYLMDQIRGRWAFPELLANAKAFWAKHTAKERFVTPASKFYIENKASGISLVQSLRTQADLPVRAWNPKPRTAQDKVGRAKQATPCIHAGRVFLPDWRALDTSYKWVDTFVGEHTAFSSDDSHLFDDQVDTHTEANAIWQEMGGGTGPLPIWDGI